MSQVRNRNKKLLQKPKKNFCRKYIRTCSDIWKKNHMHNLPHAGRGFAGALADGKIFGERMKTFLLPLF
jgi:hypothetical protein